MNTAQHKDPAAAAAAAHSQRRHASRGRGASSPSALPNEPPNRLVWRCPQPESSKRRTAPGTCSVSAAVLFLSEGCVLSHSGGASPCVALPSFSKTRGATVGSKHAIDMSCRPMLSASF